MAYADKITNMRRLCLITGGVGNIEWEGVNIEGSCVLKMVGHEIVMVKTEDELFDFCETYDYERPLFVVYQDEKTEDWFEPRLKREKEVRE